MGIDIQQYRACIGSFVNSFRNIYKKSSSTKCNKSTEDGTSRKLIFITVLILASYLVLFGNLYQNQHQCKTSSTSQLQTSLLQSEENGHTGIFINSLFTMVTNFQNRYKNGNRRAKGIKIAHWNKGSSLLTNKMPEIRNIMSNHHPHILGLSEANLFDVHDQSLVAVQDYDLHLCPTITNPSLKVSRVVVYTHKDLIVKLRPDLMCNTYSSVWLEVGLPRHKKFLVCQTYREWQYTNQRGDRSSNTIPQQLTRWLVFMDQWEKALATGMEVICLGDINLNHCNWTDPNLPTSNQSYKLRELISTLFTRIIPHGVTQLVTGPTRHFPGQVSTGLDHYYSNKPEKLSPVQKHHLGGSDHMMISAVRHSKTIRSSPKYIRKRSFKNFDPQLFVATVQQVSWLDVYLCNDVDEAVEIFSNKITEILDVMAPMKTIQVRTNYSPWLSKETLELMKVRDELQKLASETKCREDWKRYKEARNKVNNKLKYEESNWRRVRLEECGKDSGKTWRNVKGILNWKGSGSPNQLFYRGSLRTKSQDIADAQNEYFVNKIETIRSNLPPALSDPLAKLKSLMENRTCAFRLSTVHPDEVLKIITNLNNSSAFGMDQIDTSVIKLIKNEILPAVTHIINLSITTRKFPLAWKKSKIVPLHKKDDVLDPKNYRPVAIVPILSKVLERVVFNQMIEYLNKNNLLHPNHHAYRAQHNTTTALVQMYDSWLQAVETGQLAGVCLLDMSAAFDVVDHDLLLQKLSLYGMEENILSWIQSYLTGRSQCVVIEGSLSRLLPVNHGVPQGSILGPLLYTLFTNELPEVIHDHHPQQHQQAAGLQEDEGAGPLFHIEDSDNGSICCYADDTTLSCTEYSPQALTNKLSEKYKIIAEFMRNNMLKLNDDKTHLLVMDTGQSKVRHAASRMVEIRTPSETIKPSKAEKLLGCWVSEDLK